MRQRPLATGFVTLFVAALVLRGVARHATAQLPTARLFSVFPSGGKQGTTVEITITGGDLEEVNQLYFDHPGIKAELVQEMKDGKPVLAGFLEDVPVGAKLK